MKKRNSTQLLSVALSLFLIINALHSKAQYETFGEFKQELNSITGMENETEMQAALDDFWNELAGQNKIPFIAGSSVMFMYRGEAESVIWVGDFNGWNVANGYEGEKIARTNLWIVEKTFPADARLDYKLILDGDNWILDPENDYVQMSGYGLNSELRMPDWEFPQETMLYEGVERGTLSSNKLISSSYLNYDVNYKVYTPNDYDNLSDLPVIYVTDGHEYAADDMGAMVIVLDNLILTQEIPPLMAVFIDPREPGNPNNNRRGDEYMMNPLFADFVALELVPQIDENYKTNTSADARAILGTSLGGMNSGYFGITHSETFHLIGIHSPAFMSDMLTLYQESERLPLKIFMSTGVIFDTQTSARKMKTIMNQKGYPLYYIEVNEGHSWGNWRALIDEPLKYFFNENYTTVNDNFDETQTFTVKWAGNPISQKRDIQLNMSDDNVMIIKIVSMDGRCVYKQKRTLHRGEHHISLPIENLQNGMYLCIFSTKKETITKKMVVRKK